MEVALPAVRMSLADVATLLEKARGFLSASGSLKDRTTDTLTLSDGVRRFQLANDFSPTALKGAPNFSDEFSYSFIASAGPVTGVSIDLSDFRRRVSVKGPNQAQVEALAQLLQAEFQDHVTHAAGPTARLVVAIILILIGFILINYYEGRYWLLGVGALILLMGFGMVFNTGDFWLPGVAIYRGSPDFLTRYEKELTLFGLILGIAALGVHLWHLKHLSQQPQPSEGRAKLATSRPRKAKQ
jgi:hypothetical protein